MDLLICQYPNHPNWGRLSGKWYVQTDYKSWTANRYLHADGNLKDRIVDGGIFETFEDAEREANRWGHDVINASVRW